MGFVTDYMKKHAVSSGQSEPAVAPKKVVVKKSSPLKQPVKSVARTGRPPIGEVAMTGAERVALHRQRARARKGKTS